MNLWWRSAAVFVLLGCLSSSARANDLGPQDVPDQVPADEEPFQQQYQGAGISYGDNNLQGL